jgi:hypothetical protein
MRLLMVFPDGTTGLAPVYQLWWGLWRFKPTPFLYWVRKASFIGLGYFLSGTRPESVSSMKPHSFLFRISGRISRYNPSWKSKIQKESIPGGRAFFKRSSRWVPKFMKTTKPSELLLHLIDILFTNPARRCEHRTAELTSLRYWIQHARAGSQISQKNNRGFPKPCMVVRRSVFGEGYWRKLLNSDTFYSFPNSALLGRIFTLYKELEVRGIQFTLVTSTPSILLVRPWD